MMLVLLVVVTVIDAFSSQLRRRLDAMWIGANQPYSKGFLFVICHLSFVFGLINDKWQMI
jgi:hypothetical protein